MKGLQLSKQYYQTYGKPMLEQQFSQYINEIAVGLVGEGSECFGYDDQQSQDHDFFPRFCLFVPEEIYPQIAEPLQRAYDALPQEFIGYSRKNKLTEGRDGVFGITSFYNRYTNCGAQPKDIIDWIKIPERFLATITNGEVFVDNKGEFTAARENFKRFYPRDAALKKLAARLAMMAQSGQYNYPRMANRSDYGACYLSQGEFVKNALSAIFILNRQYMPFYKWAFQKAKELPYLQSSVQKLERLIALPDGPANTWQKIQLIEDISQDIIQRLKMENLTSSNDSFLEPHAWQIMARIEDPRIKNLHIMADFD